MTRRSTISNTFTSTKVMLSSCICLATFFLFSLKSTAQNSNRSVNCVNPPVTADLFAANNVNTICNGGRTSLRVNITGGTAPYRIVVNTGTSDSVITNYTLGRNIIVQPSITTTYTLLSVTDQSGCVLTGLSDTTTIFVNAKPTSAIIYTRTSPSSICTGSSAILQVRVFGGVSPFNVVYSDGVNNFTINNYTNRSNIIVNPTDTTTYRLVSVSNSTGSGCNALYSTINTSFPTVLVSSPSQAGQVSGSTSVCANSNAVNLNVAGYSGNIQWQVADSSNGLFQNISGANSENLSLNNLTSSKYYRTSVVHEVCPASYSSAVPVEVFPTTQAGTISGQSLVCSGSSASLQLNNYTGSIQWQSSLNNIDFNNISGENTSVISTSLNRDTVYFRALVNSGVCAAAASNSFMVAASQKGVWTGADNNDWNNPSNWSCGIIPDSSTDVVIAANAPNGNPTIGTANAAARNISMALNAGIEIAEGQTLSLFGNINGQGKLDSRFGNIHFSATVIPQIISGSLFYNNTIKQLKVSNPSGITIGNFVGDTLKVSDRISFGTNNAKLITNNNLVLLSNATGTASIADMTSDGVTSGVYVGNRIIGDVTVERFIPAHSKAWQFLSVPATGRSIKANWQEGNASGLNTNNPGYGIMLSSNNSNALNLGFDMYTPAAPSIKVYNVQTGNWDGVSSTFDNIDNSKGYMVFVRGDRSISSSSQTPTQTILRTSGKLYTPIDNPPAAVVVPSGKFESIGNPYASAIDFTKLIKTGGVQDAFYVWDPKLTNSAFSSYGLGGYQTFIGNGNGTYRVTPGGGSYDSINTNSIAGIIQSGQAFFVHSTSVAGTVGFTESSKANSSALVTRNGSVDNMQLGAKLSVFNNNQSVLLDGVFTEFGESFENDIDGNDIPKINIGSETISILRSSQQWVAERRKTVTTNDTIFYQLNQLKTKTYQLAIQPEFANTAAVQAQIIDNYLGTSTPINLNQNTLVVFNAIANDASASPNRFMIVLHGNAVVLPVRISQIKANRIDQKTATISWKAENQINISRYAVERSTNGVKFETIAFTPARSSSNYSIVDENAPTSNCFYRLRVVENSGVAYYSEIVKLSAAQLNVGVMVSPNPVENKIANVILLNKPSGIYQMNIYNSIGQQVMAKTINYTTTQSIKLTMPSSTQPGIYNLVVSNANGEKEQTSVLIQ